MIIKKDLIYISKDDNNEIVFEKNKNNVKFEIYMLDNLLQILVPYYFNYFFLGINFIE